MKHQKLILLLLLAFGAYATGIVGLLQKVQYNYILSFDEDTINSVGNINETLNSKEILGDHLKADFCDYKTSLEFRHRLLNQLLHTIVSLTYQSDILEIVAPPPES